MRTYADTSFLVALYLTDNFTPQASSYMAKNQQVLVFTELQSAEVRNAFRLRVAHKRSSSEEIFRALSNLDRDLGEGILEFTSINWPELFREYERISAKYTEQEAHRFADILHLASALTLRARIFLTFDQRQARLAKALGFKTPLKI